MRDTIIQGDTLTILKTLPDNLVDCVVTSPPYWGLRDYGVPGQLGLEPDSASKWIALAGLAMVALGAIVVVLLTGASEQHSRQRYASMVIVSISFAVAAVLARTTLPECRRLAKVAADAPTAFAARSAVRASLPVLEELGL